MFVNPILVYIKHYMCLFKQIFRNKAFMHSILLMKYPCLKTAHHYISDKLCIFRRVSTTCTEF